MMNYQRKILVQNLDKTLAELSEKTSDLNLPSGFLEFILYSISELFDNIKEHSRAKEVLLDFKIAKKDCFIKITDQGIGLRQSYLLKKIYPKDDLAAIEFALGGLSTKNQQERGFGLYSIRSLIESLKGKMTVETGAAHLLIEKNKTVAQKKTQKSAGVTVTIQTPIKKIAFYEIVK